MSRPCLDGVKVIFDPKLEVSGLASVSEDKDRRALHGFFGYGCEDTTAFSYHFHAAVVGGQHRPLYRRHGYIEFPLGVFAVHQ
ncbi:MAG: hypothetical protein CM15mP84_05970 [Cellvibrionales bacterium]|nr:MAG: hypothetical protein CM15mP84_05970 [Cellvibrionales bacterium]